MRQRVGDVGRRAGVVLTLMFLFGSVAGSAQAAQYSPPWAHVHYAELAYKLGWGAGWLQDAGYGVYSQSGLSSYAHWSHMKSDAVYIWAGHGNVGGGWYYPNDNLSHRIHGKGGTNSDPVYYISNYGGADVTDVLVFMLIGCDTAVTHTSSGNLLDEARAKGVDVAIGWPNNIASNTAPVLGMGFMRGARFAPSRPIDYPQGFNVGVDADLMQYAYDYMLSNCVNEPEITKTTLRTWVTKGWSSQTMQPARYGNP